MLVPKRDGSEDMEVEYLTYLISGVALNNTVITAPANKGFIGLAINFNCRMRALGINNVPFWALDKPADEILTTYRIPSYFKPAFSQTETEEAYHSENSLKMMADRPRF